MIRFGDVTGFDDSEIIEIDEDTYIVEDNEYDENESIINK
jgi:hypothetical protein